MIAWDVNFFIELEYLCEYSNGEQSLRQSLDPRQRDGMVYLFSCNWVSGVSSSFTYFIAGVSDELTGAEFYNIVLVLP